MRNRRFSLLYLSILLTIFSLSFRVLPQSQANGAAITYPGTGVAVQGLVQIIGTANVSGFQSYRLEFASSTSSSPSWFLITQRSNQVNNDILGEWDTSILTDGDYTIRLTVESGTGQQVAVSVEGIRIRNYSPIETDTPAPTSQDITGPEAISTDTPAPTEISPVPPTDLPPNSISISSEKIKRSVVIGGLLGLFGTVFIILYAGYRQKH